MEIKPFLFTEQYSQLTELFKIHWEEIASNKNTRTLNVDFDFFNSLEKNSSLLCVGVFDRQTLVGYSINIITRDTHDCTKQLCCNDALFLHPSYRKSSFGIRLIKETEQLAKALGVYGIIWHTKPSSSLDKILEKLHYEIKDFLYLKEL